MSGGVFSGTAANITNVSVFGGTGNDTLNASGVIMPVTLDGTPGIINAGGVETHAPVADAGSSVDLLTGGAGSDTLYYNGPQSTYDGGAGGPADMLVYAASASDNILFSRPATPVRGCPTRQ